ncbi:MAG: hypothetical protein AAB066_05385, partial [Candidatus Margulisiibacteriota bacterium]
MDTVTTFSTVMAQTDPQAVLVDASGVLYNDDGMIPGAVVALNEVQRQGSAVFVVTNNTSASVSEIHSFLHQQGLVLPVSHIISSGLGLSLDPVFCDLMHDRNVFVVGETGSMDYVTRCEHTRVVSDPQQADVIVLAASSGDDFNLHLDRVTATVNSRPDLPVICINPDHYVQTRETQFPVIGYFAAKLAQQTGVKILWMGKPHASFSPVVATVLRHHDIDPRRTVFLDDNYRNVL